MTQTEMFGLCRIFYMTAAHNLQRCIASFEPDKIGFKSFNRIHILFVADSVKVLYIEGSHLFKPVCPYGNMCNFHWFQFFTFVLRGEADSL